MKHRKKSKVQGAIDLAAADYMERHQLRGSPAYHIAKHHGLVLGTVQRVLDGGNCRLETLEEVSSVLGLEIVAHSFSAKG